MLKRLLQDEITKDAEKKPFFFARKSVQITICAILALSIVFGLNDKVFSADPLDELGAQMGLDTEQSVSQDQRKNLESLNPNKPAVSQKTKQNNEVSTKVQLKPSSKKVKISVSGSARNNPFLPSREDFGGYNIASPPESVIEDSEAQKIMETTISGILFDEYSPSAIININDSDYLVKKGDKINGYKVLSILKDKVVVQLGKNVYKAGVGELLAQDKINYNDVPNLEKKFGGGNVSINVKKKGINQE